MDERRDLGIEGSACLLRIEAAAALLRVDVADLAAELSRGTLPTGLVDGVPHLDGNAVWRYLDPQAQRMPRHLIAAVRKPARGRGATVGACPTPRSEHWSTEPSRSPEGFSQASAIAGSTPGA